MLVACRGAAAFGTKNVLLVRFEVYAAVTKKNVVF
jgi:hypothetical protein